MPKRQIYVLLIAAITLVGISGCSSPGEITIVADGESTTSVSESDPDTESPTTADTDADAESSTTTEPGSSTDDEPTSGSVGPYPGIGDCTLITDAVGAMSNAVATGETGEITEAERPIIDAARASIPTDLHSSFDLMVSTFIAMRSNTIDYTDGPLVDGTFEAATVDITDYIDEACRE